MSYISLVSDFHKAFRYKQPEPTTPDLTCAATNKLRPKLLREELQETFDAAVKGDRIALLDGLCDTQYVLSGAILAWGFRPMYAHLTPMIDLRKIRDEEAHFFAMFGQVEQMEIAAENNYPVQVISCLKLLESYLRTAVYHYGFTECFADAFAEVHRSNMSKLWTYEELDDAPPAAFIENIKGKHVVRRHDGKIMKSPSYSPARLERFV